MLMNNIILCSLAMRSHISVNVMHTFRRELVSFDDNYSRGQLVSPLDLFFNKDIHKYNKNYFIHDVICEMTT